MKIAILTNASTMDKCTGRGCFKAFNGRKDAFEGYDAAVELVAFTHAGGDLDKKIRKLKDNGVEVVHLSTCLRGKHGDYEGLMARLSKDFIVKGYTHGSKERKRKD